MLARSKYSGYGRYWKRRGQTCWQLGCALLQAVRGTLSHCQVATLRTPSRYAASQGGLLCCRAFLTRCSFLPQISQGTDVAALPAAATCFNTMRLPKYPSKAVLRKKVVLAALECSGFAFS